MNRLDLTYRQTAAEGASGISMLLPLFDRLATDLRLGAEAQRNGDLAKRSKELNHALALLGFLDNWIDRDSGELAQQLSAFYARLRRRIIEAQARQSAQILEEEMAATLKLREVWQQLDLGTLKPGPEILSPAQPQGYGSASSMQMGGGQLSWSA